jgi:hypothetical protein
MAHDSLGQTIAVYAMVVSGNSRSGVLEFTNNYSSLHGKIFQAEFT